MFLKKFHSILKENKSFSLVTMIVLGFIAGLSGTMFIIIINKVIRIDPDNATFHGDLFLGFMAVLGVHFLIQVFYQASLIRLSHNMIWKLRKNTLDNVREADYLKYAAFGNNKVHGILTRDAFALSQFSQMLSSLIISFITLVSGFLYLMIVAPVACIITLLMGTVIFLINFSTRKKIDTKVKQARKVEDEYNKHFLSILGGLKELKLDRQKSDDLFNNHLSQTGEKLQEMWSEISIGFYKNALIANFLFYLLIAVFLFVLPYFNISLISNNFEYILVILYLMGPTQAIINAVPNFSYAQKALDRFEELKKLEEVKEMGIGENHPAPLPGKKGPHSFLFRNVEFIYNETAESPFALGPLNFELRAGEVTFLVGGNGSGKSTFIRLLTGLYPVKSGQIIIDDITVTATQVNSYRNLFSAVYTDSYSFDRLLGFGKDKNRNEKFNTILGQLKLNEKVSCIDDVFSTINLSYGQLKRLNLAVSLLEEKPIYVFDELAANQDADFKEYFYTTILEELKSKGKIVLVASHDEKYFGVADQILKLEKGLIKTVADQRQSKAI